MKKRIFAILFIGLLINSSFGQNINEWSKEMLLWQCPSDPNLKLMYRVNFGDGGYNSLVELVVPTNIGQSIISGVLKIEENKDRDNFTAPTSKTETIKIDQSSIDKQYNFRISGINQISFEGACTGSNSKIKVTSNIAEKYDFKGAWSEWATLWEEKKDTINVQYRTRSYIDESTKKQKTDVEIQGPKNYSGGEVFIRGYIKDGPSNELSKNSFILSETGKSRTFTIDSKDFTSDRIILTSKKYKSYKPVKLKTKTAVIGDRG